MKKMNTHARGFTLIELLVVIAIIGILSSIVLASLATARSKGRAAAAKEALVNLRSEMEVYYNGGGPGTFYGTGTAGTNGAVCSEFNFIADPSAYNLINSVASQGLSTTTGPTMLCSVDANPATLWAIAVQLPDGSGDYCLDNAGDVKADANAIITSGVQLANGACI